MIEFHFEEAVASHKEVIHWAAFALGLVSNAVTRDWDKVKEITTDPDVGELYSAVIEGLKSLGMAPRDVLLIEAIRASEKHEVCILHQSTI